MTHALFKQIDLTAKLGQDGSSLQAMNALRVIRETVAKHLAGTEGAGEIPLERALQALHTIAEFPCSEQDDLPAANMRQIALAALSGAGAGSEPGNPGREPVSGPGNAGGLAEAERPEVVGYRSKESGMVYEQDYGLKNPEALTTFAECERIVGALRADRDSWAEQAEQRLADWDEMRKERDAALANVDALAVQVLKLGGTISFAHHRTDQAGQVPQAWLDVQAERRRQVEAEGWTPEHDDEHSHGQMARAAACYALAGSSAPNDGTAALLVSLAWPWDEQWWKPSTARRDMVKACALALAEIERLDRAGISQSPQPGATTASS
ncbi:hypothetical protein ABZQ57_27605 [Pseudomonas aeruginosa]